MYSRAQQTRVPVTSTPGGQAARSRHCPSPLHRSWWGQNPQVAPCMLQPTEHPQPHAHDTERSGLAHAPAQDLTIHPSASPMAESLLLPSNAAAPAATAAAPSVAAAAGYCRHIRTPSPTYSAYLVAFFLLATVLALPLRVRALVFVRWPRTGRPMMWRRPR